MAGTIPDHLREQLSRMDLLEPVDPDANTQWRPASRLLNLHGKSGGFLGNRKANADLLLRDIKEILEKRFELRDSLVLEKSVYSRPASEDIVDALSERCDFVVTAIAD
jgi:hypothetical protein